MTPIERLFSTEHTQYITVTGAVTYDIEPGARLVLVNTAAAATGLVRLPPVGESAGRRLTFKKMGSGTNKFEIIDYGDDSFDATALEGLDFDAAGDGLTIESDSLRWNILENDVA